MSESQDEIRTPADVYGRLFEEVGIENQGILQETIERHIADPIMTTGSVEDGIKYIVNLTKERRPKPKPEPQPFEDGYVFPTNTPTVEKGRLTDSLIRRRAQRRGR